VYTDPVTDTSSDAFTPQKKRRTTIALSGSQPLSGLLTASFRAEITFAGCTSSRRGFYRRSHLNTRRNDKCNKKKDKQEIKTKNKIRRKTLTSNERADSVTKQRLKARCETQLAKAERNSSERANGQGVSVTTSSAATSPHKAHKTRRPNRDHPTDVSVRAHKKIKSIIFNSIITYN